MKLFLRSIFWTIACPGTVTVLMPCLFFINDGWRKRPWDWYRWIGLALILPGVLILWRCIVAFAREGKGTLSPADPATHLVVKGLYRYVRNPMYVGVMIILAGEALLFASIPLLWYACVVFLLFNLFIRFYEEPYLRRQFGVEYEEYCKKIGRWLPF